MTALIDISRTIASGGLVYPGDPPLTITPVCTIGPGCAFNLSQLGWTTHIATHVDVPLHFLEEGASLDHVPLERFMGEALVIAVDGDRVLPDHIPASPSASAGNLLFKTRHSERFDPRTFDEQHVYVTAEAAARVAERRFNLVGIDYLSVDRHGDETYPAHRTLLGAGVLILEGLDLGGVAPGRYTLTALPLRIARGDGSPVRAVLTPR
jgi:arylformamidase